MIRAPPSIDDAIEIKDETKRRISLVASRYIAFFSKPHTGRFCNSLKFQL